MHQLVYNGGMSGEVTRVLQKLESGESQATSLLLTVVYEELRRLAAAKLKNEKAGHTLQATALVHEAYLRLVDVEQQSKWQSRNHFFASAAEAMRRILIENARRKNAAKRGAGLERTMLSEEQVIDPCPQVDLLELDDALFKLERQDAQAAMLVKLRYFTGLTIEQASEVMGVSKRSTERIWTYARTWLYEELNDD